MNTAEFLDRVLPEGNRYIAWPSDHKTQDGRPIFSHAPFQDVAEALAKARSVEGKAKDAYFAVASFKVQKILDTEKGFMKAFRKQENVAKLKSLFLDIDFKQYQTEVDAVNALKAFLVTTNIPKPTIIVNSGGGLHVYWVFDRVLAPDEWAPMAMALAALGQKQGLKADFQVTIDSARILRVPGTLNFKYDPPRQCHVVSARPDNISYDVMRGFLEPFMRDETKAKVHVPGDVVQLFGPAKKANQDLSANYDAGLTYFMGPIIERCPVMNDVMARHGEGDSYPFWKDVLHLAAYTSDGYEFIHELSRGHVAYSADEVEARFEESRRVAQDNTRGPTTCERFSKHSAKCLACSYWGHIKSPISLGQEQKTKQPDEISYVIGDKTYMNVAVEDGQVERRLVCNTALQDWQYGEDHVAGAYLRFNAVASGIKKSITIECSSLADPRYLRSHMAMNSVAIYPEQVKLLERVMYSWLERLRDRGNEVEASAGFGWTHHPETKAVTGFAFAGEIYLRNGTTILGGLMDQSLSNAYGVAGMPDAWSYVAERLANDPRPEISMILASAFAAPLMRFSQAGSFTMSAYSRSSGVGKSTALACAQAVWGHPTKASNSLNDTPAAIARKMTQVRDLPAYWDELRMKDQVDAFVRLVFQLGQGKERQRLNSSARLRPAEEINTFLVVATNEPIMGAMLAHTQLSDAGSRRVFEFTVPPLQGTNLDHQFARRVTQLREHYGHAGLRYVRYMVENFDKVEAMLGEVELKLEKLFAPKQEERFWFQGAVCIITGALIAKQAGIVALDVAKLLAFLSKQFTDARELVYNENKAYDDMVSDMISFLANDLLVTRRVTRQGEKRRAWVNEVLREPLRNMVRVQIGVDEGKIWIPAGTLDHYASVKNLNIITLREMLRERFDARQFRAVVGSGTSYNVGQQSVYEIALDKLGEGAMDKWMQADDNDDLRKGVPS